jgi:hypothetical protein
MSLFNILFNRAIKIAPVYPIYDNNEPILPEDDSDTDTDCSTEYADSLELDPDLEPGDYYLQKIWRNMEDICDEDDKSDDIINVDDFLIDRDIELGIHYIYNEQIVDSLV